MSYYTESHVADEEAIVWLEDIAKFDYVRESLWLIYGRSRAPRRDYLKGVGRVVGYATLIKGARSPNRCDFERRVFWVKPYDRDSQPHGIYAASKPGVPAEGVDPRTVRPGVPGEVTERAIHGSRAR